MTIGSCFSGIGGELVAASMLGWDVKFFCEKNPFGNRVLSYWYPNAKNYEDITTADFTEWRGRVDVLTGGFPCQPFSYAGRRRGAEDDRYLWPSMYRAIDEIQPTWVVAENVAGILTMVEQGEVSKVAGSATLFDAFDDLRGRFELRETFTLQRICTDLESHGYAVQPVLVPACAVGAPHRRDRVFIVARRKGEADVLNADTDSHDEGGLRASGTTEGERSHDDIQPCEQSRRDGQTSWLANLYGFLRFAADGSNDGLQHDTVTRSETESNRETSRRGAELHVSTEADGSGRTTTDTQEQHRERMRPEQSEVGRASQVESGGGDCEDGDNWTSADYLYERLQRWLNGYSEGQREPADRYIGLLHRNSGIAGDGRWLDFPSVSPVHRGNDGLPFDVDRLTLSFGKWRTEALKAYGNAIVPQVMYEIFRAIEIVEQQNNEL